MSKPFVLQELEDLKNNLQALTQIINDAIGDGDVSVPELNNKLQGLIDSIGKPGGVAPLDEDGLIPDEYIPDRGDIAVHGNEYHLEEYATVDQLQDHIEHADRVYEKIGSTSRSFGMFRLYEDQDTRTLRIEFNETQTGG